MGFIVGTSTYLASSYLYDKFKGRLKTTTTVRAPNISIEKRSHRWGLHKLIVHALRYVIIFVDMTVLELDLQPFGFDIVPDRSDIRRAYGLTVHVITLTKLAVSNADFELSTRRPLACSLPFYAPRPRPRILADLRCLGGHCREAM
jgi:hypothetical protein